MAGVLNAGKGLFERDRIAGSNTTYPALHRLRSGQVVMRKLTAWEGPITVVPDEFDGFFASPEFPTFTLDRSRIEPDFMRLVCTRAELWGQLRDLSTGSVQRRKRVSPSRLLEVRVDLPPLVVQRRVVDLVDAVDTYAEAASEHAEAVQAARAALVIDLLQPAGTSDWTESTLGQIAEVNPEGTSGLDETAVIRYIDLSCVSGSTGIDPDAVKSYEVGQAPGRARRVVRAGDVLVSTVRPYLRGNAVVTPAYDGEVASTGFAVLRARPSVALPAFIWAVVSDPSFADRLMVHATGSSYPAVRAADVAAQLVSLPPLGDQQRVVDLVGALDLSCATAASAAVSALSARSALLGELLSGDYEIPESYDDLVGLVA